MNELKKAPASMLKFSDTPAALRLNDQLGLVERLRQCVTIKNETELMREAADAIERMQTWLEGDCNCPCCSESRKCLDDCTFASDCPDAAERMACAREALFGA